MSVWFVKSPIWLMPVASAVPFQKLVYSLSAMQYTFPGLNYEVRLDSNS